MVSIYLSLLEECIGGTDLLSDLGGIIGKDGKLQVRKAGREQGSRHSMHVLLDLMDACQHEDKWSIFYKALENNDFKHVITALKDENIPESVRKPYCEILLKPENVSYFQVLLSQEKQKMLIDGKLISREDSDNIKFERDMTGSDAAAILVLLDRLWRKNVSWINELSNIFQDLRLEDLSKKLLVYIKDETEPKELQVSKPNQWVSKSKEVRGEEVEDHNVTGNQEETNPKAILNTDISKQGESHTTKDGGVAGGLGTEQLYLAETARLNLPSLETTLEESPELLSKSADRVKLAMDEEINSKRKAEFRAGGTSNVNESMTADQVQDILNYLDATVERSELRNTSALYHDDLSEKDEDSEKSKKEKDMEEATEKEVYPTLTLREYQLELAELAVEGVNTIVCAETGTGKTYVALYITEEHLSSKTDACVVFLARTNALVEQQYEIFEKYLYKYKVYHLKTDKTAALGRKLEIAKKKNQVIFMTPQILLNNINSQQISLQEISLLILDECHHTRKREPYNNVLKQYLTLKREEKHGLPQVLGLTATIGIGKSSTEEGAVTHILSVCASLDVFEISKVRKKIKELESHVAVPKRETLKLMEKEKDMPKQIILDKIESIEQYVGKTEVVNQPKLKKQWGRKPNKKDGKQYQKWTIHFRNRVICKLKSDPKLLRKLHVALTHLSAYNEALGVNYLMNSTHVADYLKRKFEDDKNQHQVSLMEHHFPNEDDIETQFLRYNEEVCQELLELSEIINPHLKMLRNHLVDLKSDLGESVRGMIFVETRATAFALAQYISDELGMMGYKAAPFTGSKSSDNSEGMQEEEKANTLKKYREGEINLLVTTSVGSEGIDVPDCNFIITYNYTGNEADIMQMSGRARKQGSTVTHISDQTIQRREETSLQKALLMARAFDRLENMKREDRERKIREQQLKIKSAEIGSFFLESSVEKSNNSFAMICWKCQGFAVMSHDIRIFTGQHRVVLDQNFEDRCIFEETEEISRFKKRIIRCRECKTKWGTTFGVDGFEVPVLKVKAFLFVPGYTDGNLSDWKERRRFKKWGKIEFNIEKMDKSQLIEVFTKIKKTVSTPPAT
ncbi:antiviral innate immune response receptor RIG-I-like [Saccostrea echinata]|uniref:antiviral innate immune response receptor RIG-I-like n=1 Tax=Saccostrea echinata TaxID=191078 RepID=UPI002A831C66|nr:antiviral innate immune response receptor RIG-I-like [Saccostrea echinata]